MNTAETSQIAPTAVDQKPNIFRRLIAIPEVGIMLPLIGFIIIFYALNPIFLSYINIATMVRAMSFIGVIALAQTFLMISGEFDLSVGAVAGMGAIIASYCMVNLNLPVAVAILIGLGSGALTGLANSFVVFKLKVPAFITTLGMMNIARGITYLISKGYSIYPLPDSIKVFGTAQPLGISWSFFIFIGLAVVADQVLRRTTYGRKLYIVGGNREVALLAGINPDRIKTSGFVLVGMAATGAGMLLMARLVTGQPTIGLGWELNVIAGVVIGGVSLFGGSGTIAGAVLGLLIMQVVNTGLIVVNVDPYWQTITIGLIMIIAVAIDILRKSAKTAE